MLLFSLVSKLIFIFQTMLTSKTFRSEPQTVLDKPTSDLSTVVVLLFGVIWQIWQILN